MKVVESQRQTMDFVDVHWTLMDSSVKTIGLCRIWQELSGPGILLSKWYSTRSMSRGHVLWAFTYEMAKVFISAPST
jgi:hypothetical protein